MDVRTLIVSASLGGFDQERKHEKQSVNCDYFQFTDENFPPRYCSMTPRLQARIAKMFHWQIIKDYDYYLWIDSSCRLSHRDSVKWIKTFLGERDIVTFKHPDRNTIQEEADYLKYRLSINCPYITPRYTNELIDEQLEEVDPNQELYASTVYMYKNSTKVQQCLKEWWYHTSRYHLIDQLSFPYVISSLSKQVIPDSYMKTEFLEYMR